MNVATAKFENPASDRLYWAELRNGFSDRITGLEAEWDNDLAALDAMMFRLLETEEDKGEN